MRGIHLSAPKLNYLKLEFLRLRKTAITMIIQKRIHFKVLEINRRMALLRDIILPNTTRLRFTIKIEKVSQSTMDRQITLSNISHRLRAPSQDQTLLRRRLVYLLTKRDQAPIVNVMHK